MAEKQINPVVLSGILKTVKTFIPPDMVAAAAGSFIQQAIDYKNTLPLEEGEATAIAVAYEVNGEAYYGFAFIDDANNIKRFEQIKPVKTLVADLIKKM